MFVAIVVNVVGVIMCLWAYSRPWKWQRGPLMLLHGSSIVLGIALSCTLAALLMEVPESRGAFVVGLFVAAGVYVWRNRRTMRGGLLTSEVAAPDAAANPPRQPHPVQPIRSAPGKWGSVTVRDIENMEVQ